MRILIVTILMLLTALLAHGQTHTFPGNNVFPSTSTTDFNAGATVDFTGATVTGVSASAAWGSITGTLSSQTDLNTALTGKQAADSDLTTWATLTPSANFQTMVPHTFAQMKTDLALTIGTNVEAWSSNLDAWSAIATSTKQTADADLDTWAAVVRASGFDTYVATPTSANLRGFVTDENGTGALLFNGATTPNFLTGITIGGAAATGTILQGDGTKFAASTPTWPTAAGTVGYTVRSDGTNLASYPQDMLNSSVAASGTITTAETYVTGSSIVVAAGDFKAKGQYRCLFQVTKTAGTGAIVISLRIGTAGTTSDALIQTYTFGAGTGVADTGTFEVIATFRTVGSGTSAVVQGICRGQHNLAATGLWNNTVSSTVIMGSPSPSSGFATNAATTIGVTFTGSTAFSGSMELVQAQLVQ